MKNFYASLLFTLLFSHQVHAEALNCSNSQLEIARCNLGKVIYDGESSSLPIPVKGVLCSNEQNTNLDFKFRVENQPEFNLSFNKVAGGYEYIGPDSDVSKMSLDKNKNILKIVDITSYWTATSLWSCIYW